MDRTPMDVKKAAAYTGFSRQQLYSMTSKRKIPYYKTGEGKNSKIVFSKEELDEFLFAHRIPTDAELQEMSSKAVCG